MAALTCAPGMTATEVPSSNSAAGTPTTVQPRYTTTVRTRASMSGKRWPARRDSTLLTAKPMPPISPDHSAALPGSGTPTSGVHNISPAPNRASATSPSPAADSRSPRNSRANSAVQTGVR
ncbi:hypothetical protein D9M68_829940 [compost metagenome]